MVQTHLSQQSHGSHNKGLNRGQTTVIHVSDYSRDALSYSFKTTRDNNASLVPLPPPASGKLSPDWIHKKARPGDRVVTRSVTRGYGCCKISNIQ